MSYKPPYTICSDITLLNTDEIILNFLKINPKVTIKIFTSKIILTTRAIEKQLVNLKKENRLQRVRNTGKGEWIVNEKDKLIDE